LAVALPIRSHLVELFVLLLGGDKIYDFIVILATQRLELLFFHLASICYLRLVCRFSAASSCRSFH
jgi:hypothetical protein